MISNSLMIAIGDAREAVEQAVEKNPALSLDDRLRAAFAVTRHHWLVTNDDEQFRAGVGGVLTASPSEVERERIEAELHSLKVLQAAMSGVPVDFEAALGKNRPEPIGMVGIWRESRP